MRAFDYLRMKRRKQQADLRKYDALIATPADTEVLLPANGRFAIVSVEGNEDETLAATVEGASTREFNLPELDAGGRVVIGFLERATTVTLETGFQLQVDAGLGRWSTIAEAS